MSKITFIIGGARSGKSSQALQIAKKYRKVAFIPTCAPLDKEMEKRIQLHKKSRPKHWKTFENPKDIPALLKKIGSSFEIIVIDCLTLWVSNLLLSGAKERAILAGTSKIAGSLKKIKAESIIVSNEVGLGIVPKNRLARDFRDIAGRVNQIMASKSSNIFFMFGGVSLKLK